MKKFFLFAAALCTAAALNANTIPVAPGAKAIEGALTTFEAGDTLLLSTGEYNETTYELTFDKDITLLADEDAKPVVILYEACVKANFHAEGIALKNVGSGNRTLRTRADVGEISFKNCTFNYDGSSQMIYLSSNTVGSLTFDGCLFTTGNTAASMFLLQAQGATITNFTLTNTTVMNAGAEGATQAFISEHISNALVDHCTFYNCGVQNLYIKGEELNCQVKNCIFYGAEGLTDNCIKTYAGTVTNCLYYNIAGPRDGDAELIDCFNEDPLFVDAENGDLSLSEESPAIEAATDGTNLGDPRWNPTTPDPEYIEENFFLDWENAEGIGTSTVDVNDGVLTILANAEAWGAGGATIDFDGIVLGADLAGVKGAFKCAATKASIDIYPYVIDADGNRWYEKGWKAKNCADWTEFNILPTKSLWDGQSSDDFPTLDIVAFGFIGTAEAGLENYQLELKDVEILVGEQPVGLQQVLAAKKATKIVRDGQIVIFHRGERFNILGVKF